MGRRRSEKTGKSFSFGGGGGGMLGAFTTTQDLLLSPQELQFLEEMKKQA